MTTSAVSDKVGPVGKTGPDDAILTLADVKRAGKQGLPADLPVSSYELLQRSAAAFGDRAAIAYFATADRIDDARRVSYAELFAQVTRTANMLHRLGIRPGDVVALLLPNLPETHFALWGSEAAGIVMPLNPLLEPRAIGALLEAAGAKVLITLGGDDELSDKVVAALLEAPSVADVILLSETEASGSDGLKDRLAASERAIGVHDFSRCVAAERGDLLVSGRTIAPGDFASYFCTGGTTGLPKIATRTHGQVMANTWMAGRMTGPAMDSRSVMFCGLPLFHVNAVLVTGLAPFSKGATALIGTPQGYRNRDVISRFWEIVERHRVTAFSAVPTLLVSLLDQPSGGRDISSLRFAICGAAPLSAEVLHRFEETCRTSISEGYGMTETVCVASLNPIDGEHRPGSVGLPLPLQRIRIVVLDEGGAYVRDAETDESGVVAIEGPNVFSGYLDPAHNTNAWVDRGDGLRWLNTGDLGRIDADGYVWLTGRAKDLIIRGGHNIDPLIIEEALYSHRDVALAAAVGRPDARVGELPVAYVELREGATISEGELLTFVGNSIAERAAVPKAIMILDKLPLTAVGKLHKPTLRHREMTLVAKATLDAEGVNYRAIGLREDGVGGASVLITVDADLEGAVTQALQLFTFPWIIECD